MTTLSEDEVNTLVTDNVGWTESIARSVARAWNLDWQMDGLDGAAMEALFFCARRYDPSRGVPFRSYARRRIHEASTDAARKTKAWIKGGPSGSSKEVSQQSKEISAQLLNVFPELREGELPALDEGGDEDVRGSIRQLLMGASILAAKQEGEGFDSFEETLDAKRMIEVMALLEPVHQLLMWMLYWEGHSMRGIAEQWQLDELNVIREHKALLAFLNRSISKGKAAEPPKVRPGLKDVAIKINKEKNTRPFSSIQNGFGDGRGAQQ